MSRRPPLPAHLGAAFTTRQARDSGVTAKQLLHRDVSAPFHGVRMRHPLVRSDDDSADAARREDILGLARAYQLTMGDHVFFSHVTAAAIWNLPLPFSFRSAESLEVSVHYPRRAPTGRGVVGHQLRPALGSVGTIDGLRISSPASTWAALADRLDVDALIALGDAIVRVPRKPGGFGPPGRQLATLGHLAAAVAAGRRVGVGELRAALPFIRDGVSSPTETDTRLLLQRAGLPDPVLDFDVYAEDGTFLGCSEIVYPEFRVAVECEGDHHRVDPRQWNRDIEKYQRYVESGWRVVRLTRDLVYRQPDEAIRRVHATLVAAGYHS